MDDDAVDTSREESRGDAPQAVTVTVRHGDTIAPGNVDHDGQTPRKVGRPVKYDRAFIDGFGADMEQWFLENPSHVFFEEFVSSRGLHMRQCRRFCETSPEFAEAWERCACLQAARILSMSGITQFTPKGQTFFALNPRIAVLLLQSKHGYTTKEEVTLKAPEADEYTRIEAARRTLEQTMPQGLPKAREWLQSIQAGTDAVTAAAAEQILARFDLEQQALAAGDALVQE